MSKNIMENKIRRIMKSVAIAYAILFLVYVLKSLKYGLIMCKGEFLQGGYSKCSLMKFIGNHFFETLFFVVTPIGICTLIIIATLSYYYIKRKSK